MFKVICPLLIITGIIVDKVTDPGIAIEGLFYWNEVIGYLM